MNFSLPVFLILAAGMFAIGAIVGSFLNLCIARVPWEQSVFWPASRCDGCGESVRGADLVPILGWIRLGGKSRCCGATLPGRYPLVELLTAVLFVIVLATDSVWAQTARPSAFTFWAAVTGHSLCAAFLVVIAFIDLDLTIVPPPVTNFGIVTAILLGAIAPGFRPEPCAATTTLGGLGVGLLGLAVGAGLVWLVRLVGGWVAGGEAMGAGDIHIQALVGAFLGWQISVLTFFLAAFYGLIPSLWKLIPYLVKRLTGREWKASDHEIPLGPFLALGAATLMLAWPWLWPAVIQPYFMMIESILSDAPPVGVEN